MSSGASCSFTSLETAAFIPHRTKIFFSLTRREIRAQLIDMKAIAQFIKSNEYLFFAARIKR
jgi:hypothetical protein